MIIHCCVLTKDAVINRNHIPDTPSIATSWWECMAWGWRAVVIIIRHSSPRHSCCYCSSYCSIVLLTSTSENGFAIPIDMLYYKGSSRQLFCQRFKYMYMHWQNNYCQKEPSSIISCKPIRLIWFTVTFCALPHLFILNINLLPLCNCVIVHLH